MKKSPWDPDIQTIYQRIKERDLDLQPDFQRGEVWSPQKKQRLIDSILRDWHVPPIHVIESADGKQEVLDGQQRLVAIRDYIENKFSVDGAIPPQSSELAALSGMTFSQLPPPVKRRFNNYSLRVYKITEYAPGEPGELFFRLNQPTSLTAAETRNAFIGVPRNQVRELVGTAIKAGLSRDTIAMSPSRMAYDDVVARFCATLEFDSLLEKVTAADVTARYRRGDEFASHVLERAKTALVSLGEAAGELPEPVRLNKATIHTWLVFIASHRWKRPAGAKLLADFISRFESARASVRGASSPTQPVVWPGGNLDDRVRFRALHVFNDRTSSRVADVSSVVVRDAITWMFWALEFTPRTPHHDPRVEQSLRPVLKPLKSADDEVYAVEVPSVLETMAWGKPL